MSARAARRDPSPGGHFPKGLGARLTAALSGPARIIHALASHSRTRLGVYDITAQIGEVGMGAVYRATDTSLGRQVAVKVLPDAFAADPDRLARW